MAAEPKDIQKELEALQLEEAKLRLEDLRWTVEQRRQEKLQKQVSHAQVESDLKQFRDNVAASQAKCNHRKGGRGVEGLHGNGTDSMYSVIHHKFGTGDVMVMCSRCQKMWLPGDEGYNVAIQYPTDNTMSEAVQFRFEKVTLNA